MHDLNRNTQKKKMLLDAKGEKSVDCRVDLEVPMLAKVTDSQTALKPYVIMMCDVSANVVAIYKDGRPQKRTVGSSNEGPAP